MNTQITTLADDQLNTVSGGVIADRNGRGCTEPKDTGKGSPDLGGWEAQSPIGMPDMPSAD